MSTAFDQIVTCLVNVTQSSVACCKRKVAHLQLVHRQRLKRSSKAEEMLSNQLMPKKQRELVKKQTPDLFTLGKLTMTVHLRSCSGTFR